MSEGQNIIREEFLKRKRKNPAYSTRAFARDAGLSQAYVSYLLSGRRQLPPKRALEVSLRLNLTDSDRTRFLASIFGITSGRESLPREWSEASDRLDSTLLTIDHFKAVSSWYHLALLDLISLKQFKPTFRWAAKALGITEIEVRDAAERLARLKLLSIEKGKWKKIHSHLRVSPNRSTDAVRTFHKQMISKSLEALDLTSSADFDRRCITGIMFGIDPKKLPEAFDLIEDFKEKMAKLLTSGEATDLYQMNIQLFSLLKPLKEKP